ncbi:hypothetical protein [Streptomyces violascens]|uniref:Uncharacterized protein n=1 Tax=Streptomyces violascens TaxID=67381 RepID=A0ABQ3QVE0_9ACTN|nr:hypothetical protein [Streptomyces violascens]GGU44218.1 hypothetical protein GCM10010289_76120 [Streptomyces violascens]GHI41179.1 hypothetical protein Sviol_55870 [Streptomyces violascens]
MLSEAWILETENITIGRLELIEIDQPWFRCRFSPADGWEAAKEIFEEQAAAVDSGNAIAMVGPIEAVKQMDLKLFPVSGGDPITPVIIQIRGETASFRY